MQELIVGLITFIIAFAAVLSIVGAGWYLVWKYWLSRYVLIRELLGAGKDSEPKNRSLTRGKGNRKVRKD